MKIAVVAHVKFPIAEPFAGGLERHTSLLVRGLQARGHAVTLFCAEGADRTLPAVEICAPTGPLRGDPRHDAAVDAAEDAAYRRIVGAVASGGFDLVHHNALHALPLARCEDLAVPLVTTLHVPPFEPFASTLASAGPRVGVLAVSNTLARAWRPVAPWLEVVPNGVDLLAFPYRPAPDPERYGIWCGRISPEKGLHVAIDAARLAGLPLRIARGILSSRSYWDEMIRPRLGDGVVDLGRLGGATLAAQIGGARVAVASPLWEEPFGLVVAEALACGTPVAGFRRGALPDLLDDRTGRLATPDDVSALAQAIRDAQGLDRAACRARAETMFDASRMIAGYDAFYDTRIMAHRRSTHPPR